MKLRVKVTREGLVVGLEVTFSGDHVDIPCVVRRTEELPCCVVIVLSPVGLELMVADLVVSLVVSRSVGTCVEDSDGNKVMVGLMTSLTKFESLIVLRDVEVSIFCEVAVLNLLVVG